jgi:putative Ca2+/H+ antiporter (TMEM165/GDT1 family)
MQLSGAAAGAIGLRSGKAYRTAMNPLLISTVVVALAEIGDKTQLLALVLATRFRQPVPIIAGILAATIANHLLAATAGYYLSDLLGGTWFRLLVAVSFLAMAAWTLIPDKADEAQGSGDRWGAFLTTLVAFFLVEIGDKTQLATLALAARFHSIVLVAAGTTLGMMIADVPAVLLGEAATRIVPLRYVRWGAAALFAVLGLWALAEALKLV